MGSCRDISDDEYSVFPKANGQSTLAFRIPVKRCKVKLYEMIHQWRF
jgi:hypothetical protein